MVHLLTVGSAFQARVLVARLGSEGIVTSLRGSVDGPYPFGDVGVFVDEEDLELARQLLLADEVEAAFVEAGSRRGGGRGRSQALPAWAAVLAVVFVAVASSLARVVTL
jgi:hypothetical protein